MGDTYMYTIYTRRDIPDARHDPKCGGNPRDGHEKCLIYTQGQHRRVTRTCTRYVHVGTNLTHDTTRNVGVTRWTCEIFDLHAGITPAGDTYTYTIYIYVGTNRTHDMNDVYISDHGNRGPVGLLYEESIGTKMCDLYLCLKVV